MPGTARGLIYDVPPSCHAQNLGARNGDEWRDLTASFSEILIHDCRISASPYFALRNLEGTWVQLP